jgi:hypothetical protein
MTDTLASQSEFARLLPTFLPERYKKPPTPQYIHKLVRQGKLPVVGKKIQVAAGIEAMRRSEDPSRGSHGTHTLFQENAALEMQAIRPLLTASAAGDDENSDPLGNRTTYAAHRTKREYIAAEMAQLELERERGKLVEKEHVVRVVENAFKALREQLLNLPAQLAGQLSAMTDERTIRLTMEESFRAALEQAARRISEQ